jgi:hypothetical protein
MRLEKITKEKQHQLEKDYYDKYADIYDAVVKYIGTQNVLLYGGTALNEYLSADLKIYGEYVLPDIDVLCLSPKTLADKVVAHLNKKGFVSSTYSGKALHAGTYTVYCSGLKVLDASYASSETMRSIRHGGIRGPLGIMCASPLFLRFTLHQMLAGASVSRWDKVSKRLRIFYSMFPPDQQVPLPFTPQKEAVAAVNRAIHYYTEGIPNTMLLGTPLVNFMLYGAQARFYTDEHLKIPYNIVIVKENCKVYAQTMIQALAPTVKQRFRISEVHSGNSVLGQSTHVIVSHDGRAVALIFEDTLDSCLNYNVYKGVFVATIHTVLMVYLGMMLSPAMHFVSMKPALKVITNSLAVVVLQSKSSKLKIMQPLSLTCLGEEAGVATLRRRRFDVNK